MTAAGATLLSATLRAESNAYTNLIFFLSVISEGLALYLVQASTKLPRQATTPQLVPFFRLAPAGGAAGQQMAAAGLLPPGRARR